MPDDEGLLTLTMIVKNEAATIAHTLETVKPWIDRWIVLDTGSTDGTQEVVRQTMNGVAGAVHEEAFVDFATTRNLGLDRCGTETDFILWLDADDYLDGGKSLRDFLRAERKQRGPDREAYYVRVEAGPAVFDSARVVRSSAGWRFKGAVHEVLLHPDRQPPSRRAPDARVRHVAGADAGERSRQRWHRDVELLRRELEADPSATRPAFYLGMTLHWLERYDEAAVVLDRRIAMGGWAEEVFYAKLTKARAAHAAKRAWAEVLALYLEAHSFAPHRAEPLVAIAARYDGEGDHALAMLFARRAYELPLPSKDSLFIEEETYTWRAADLVGTHAFWLGELELGEQAARKAVRARPDDARLKKNVSFYVQKASKRTK